MKSFIALSAAALLASSVAAHGPSGQRQAVHRRGVERLHRRTKRQGSAAVLAVAPSSEAAAAVPAAASAAASDVSSTTAIWWAEAGWVGACGVTTDSQALQVGLPLSLYPNANEKSPLCGTKAYATNPATGASVTVTVVDGSNRDGFTTFSKAAYLALGGNADTGMLPISLSLSKKAVAAVKALVAVAPGSKASSAAAVVSSNAVKAAVVASVASAAAPASITAAPVAVTPAAVPTPSIDSAAAAAASKAAASAAAAAAADASSKAAAKVFQSQQAQVLAASQAAADSSSAAAAAASSKAAAQAAASQQAAAASKQAAADAAASSKAAADAAASSAAAASSKAAAAAAASQNSDSSSAGSSGGHVYSGGYATYYTQNGVAGNCGAVNPDSAYIVALPTATYSGGSHCGQKVRITRTSTGKTITATVADSCPTCVNNSCLDLSVSAFTAIATEAEGMVDITWSFI